MRCLLEQKILLHCPQTLAGIKTGGLFNAMGMPAECLEEQAESLNSRLNSRGVYIKIINSKTEHALVYVYRRSALERDLRQPESRKILTMYGYPSDTIEDQLNCLYSRLSDYTHFPHEIGLFLGYPAEDVREFIVRRGQGPALCGCWKAYCNLEQARCTFERYKKCTAAYRKFLNEDLDIAELTAAI